MRVDPPARILGDGATPCQWGNWGGRAGYSNGARGGRGARIELVPIPAMAPPDDVGRRYPLSGVYGRGVCESGRWVARTGANSNSPPLGFFA